jgi:tape measure domain-containing protein
LAQLVVRLDADWSGMERGFTAAQRAAIQLGERMTRLGRNITIGITVPLGLAGATAVMAAAELDSLTRGLTAVTGSAAKTSAQLARLQDVAKLPGLGFREAIRGSINLQAAGLSAATAERALRAFGNALATVGKGKADLDGVILALGQIQSKGKISAEEINQLAERVPQIRTAMQAAFGTADTERLGKAGLTATRFIEGLISQLEKLPQASGGAANAFENLSDAAFRARAAIGEQLLPAILPLVDGLATVLTRLQAANPETIRWAIAIAGVAAVIGPLIALTGTLTSAVTALTIALGIAGLAGTIATGGVLLALGALSALFVKNKLDALAAASAANAYRASLLGLSEGQLIAQRTAESLRLSELRANQAAMIAAGRATMRRPGVGARGSMNASQGRSMNTPEFQTIVDRANETAAKVSSLTQAIDQLHATASVTTPVPPVLPATTRAARDTADAVDALAEKLRDLTKARIHDFKAAAIAAHADEARRVAGAAASVASAEKAFEATSAQKALDSLAQSAKAAGGALKTAERAITETMVQGLKQVAAGSSQFLSDAIRMFEAVGQAGHSLGVAALAGAAFGAGMKVLSGFFSVVGTAVEALMLPLQIMGEVLGTLIVPVLRILWGPLKLLGIVVSYIGEVIAKVAGAIANAVGHLVRGIGNLVNKLPGSPGSPLVKAGQAMIDLGASFRNAAEEMALKRKELQALSFEEALDRTTGRLNDLSEAALNAVAGFKIERYRFAALDARAASAPSAVRAATPSETGAQASGSTATTTIGQVTFNFQRGPDDPPDYYEAWKAGLQRDARRNPRLRPIAALFA